MSLFDAISNAIADPDRQANTDQIGSILGAVQSIAGSQTGDPGNSAALMSAVGSMVQGALQNYQANAGTEGVENLLSQVANGNAGSNPVQALFGGQEQQVVEAIAQRTGLDADRIGAMLPTLLPMVLQLLQSGASSSGGNSVLNTFLDSNQDGSVDMGDLMSQAGRFLGH
ncbi:DUF937 domain-containing protein [Altericista sp. CCNU0014]|uniref:DUF937 domain-containing protein n=1 Tax=Altericista sp. CCNU0014 TaxID=3082949 RepID=UPI003851425F